MLSVPYRLTCHEMLDSSGHLDLFFLVYGKNFLLTYELDRRFEDFFTAKAQEGPVFLKGREAFPQEGETKAMTERGTMEREAAGKENDHKKKEKKTRPFIKKSSRLYQYKIEGSWDAVRKKNHRLEYWNYTGRISKGRGSLYCLGYGKYFYSNQGFASPFCGDIKIGIMTDFFLQRDTALPLVISSNL